VHDSSAKKKKGEQEEQEEKKECVRKMKSQMSSTSRSKETIFYRVFHISSVYLSIREKNAVF